MVLYRLGFCRLQPIRFKFNSGGTGENIYRQDMKLKLIWSPESASKAYIETVRSCKKFMEFGVAELLSALAAGWNAKFIVELWSSGSPIATSIGLAVAANETKGRHVCIVPDEQSSKEYLKAMAGVGLSSQPPATVVGEAEAIMPKLSTGLDFLVVDGKVKNFCRVLKHVKVSTNGAILVCKNASMGNCSGFKWNGMLQKGTNVVKTVCSPVGMGLEIAYVGSSISNSVEVASPRRGPSRWIKYTDESSGEEHLIRY